MKGKGSEYPHGRQWRGKGDVHNEIHSGEEKSLPETFRTFLAAHPTVVSPREVAAQV